MIGWRTKGWFTRQAKDYSGTSIFPDIDARRFSRLTMTLNGIKATLPLKVAIVSSVSKEGVSTIAVNLANTLQRTLNWRVLLVDANFPNPALHLLSPTITGVGLAELLRGDISPESAIRRLNDHGFGLIPAGSYINTDLSVLFSRELSSRCFSALNPGEWDAVILDCPPLLTYPGSSLIAAQAEATVMVIRAEYTRYESARKSLEYLEEDGANVLGVVINNVHYYVPEWLYRQL